MENRVSAKEWIIIIAAVAVFAAAAVSAFLLKPIITVEIMAVEAVLLLIFALMVKPEKQQAVKETEDLTVPFEEAKKELAQIRRENSALLVKLESVRSDNDMLKDEINRLNEKQSAVVLDSSTVVAVNAGIRLFDEKLLEEASLVDLISVARETLEELKKYADAEGIRTNIISANASVNINANKHLISIMFRNIIDNSIKYMKRAGNLFITISDIGDDIFIICKDDGYGIDESELKHIFELNFQGSNRVSGNGLGLTQAKDIVDAYNGVIYAKSSYGNGMGIYIQIPKR